METLLSVLGLIFSVIGLTIQIRDRRRK